MHRPMILVAAVILMLVLVPGASLAKPKINIPKERLREGVYTSPAGEFTLKVPDGLGKDLGTRAEERQTGPGQWGVFFVNDFGRVFFVLWTDQSAGKKSLEELTADIQVGDMVRSKTVVDTARGPQVRVAGVAKNGSPMKLTRLRDGKMTEEPLDLGKASSLFLHGDFFYEVSAGVTRAHDDMTDEMLLENANAMLEASLGGLTFPGP